MESVLVQTFVKFNRRTPFLKNSRNNSFQSFIDAGLKNNLEVYLSRFDLYDPKRKLIRTAWAHKDRWEKVKDKSVDLVFYRGRNVDAKKIGKRITNLKMNLVNHPEIEQVCDDKIYTNMVFPEFTPKTFLINDHNQLNQALKYITTKKVVLKPRFGSYGKDVMVIDKSKLRNGITKNTLLQEFIESSNGVSKINIKGRHDIRVMMIDGKIDHCYARMPKRGHYLGNMEFGASKRFFPKYKLPADILKKLSLIDKEFKLYKTRIYSADFLMDSNNKAWLIELNSKPDTLHYEGEESLRDKYYFNICQSLKKSIKNI